MNLSIPITALIDKSRHFPVGFMEACLTLGKEAGGVLTISVADYDKAKQKGGKLNQKRDLSNQKGESVNQKANSCCGGKPK